MIPEIAAENHIDDGSPAVMPPIGRLAQRDLIQAITGDRRGVGRIITTRINTAGMVPDPSVGC